MSLITYGKKNLPKRVLIELSAIGRRMSISLVLVRIRESPCLLNRVRAGQGSYSMGPIKFPIT